MGGETANGSAVIRYAPDYGRARCRGLRIAFGAETKDYTVTTNPKMALQLVLMTAADSAAADTTAADTAPADTTDSPGDVGAKPTTQRVRFRGFRNFDVELLKE